MTESERPLIEIPREKAFKVNDKLTDILTVGNEALLRKFIAQGMGEIFHKQEALFNFLIDVDPKINITNLINLQYGAVTSYKILPDQEISQPLTLPEINDSIEGLLELSDSTKYPMDLSQVVEILETDSPDFGIWLYSNKQEGDSVIPAIQSDPPDFDLGAIFTFYAFHRRAKSRRLSQLLWENSPQEGVPDN